MLDFFFTVGITCITRCEYFEAAALLKNTHWIGLVALHDQEKWFKKKK